MIVATFCCRLLKANLKSQSFRYFATQTRIRFSRYNYYHEKPDSDNWLPKLTSWCVKALFCITSREPSRQQQWTKTVQFLELQPVGKVPCSCSWSSQRELRGTALFDDRTGCVAPGKHMTENRKGNAVFFFAEDTRSTEESRLQEREGMTSPKVLSPTAVKFTVGLQ